MDFDLEIINEEDDCPNHLFESIMNAMNSMKEATADKIYQKIQRDGETNYSKPQVDKALANALNYGIFEVNNNRYRVRDDILENEDTAYWKLHQKKDRTPFRIQEHISEKQFGLKLDPERDNQKFRKIPVTDKQECPHCGRIKILNPKKKNKKGYSQKKSEKLDKISKKKKKKLSAKSTEASYRNAGLNRKKWRGRHGEDYHMKKKKLNKENKEKECPTSDTLLKDFWSETKESREKELFHSSPSDCWDSATEFKKKKISSRHENGKARNRYLKLSEKHHNQYDNCETNQDIGKSDWLGNSDELQGTVIQSKNMLIIQPMNSLSFKSLGHTSYFT